MPSLDRHICSIHSTGKAKKWIKGRSRHYWSQFDGIVLRVLRLKISVGICKKRFSAFVCFRSAKIHWWRRHNARKINFAQDGQVQVKISSSGFCLVAPDLVHHPVLLLSVSALKSMVSICGVILKIAIFFSAASNGTCGRNICGSFPCTRVSSRSSSSWTSAWPPSWTPVSFQERALTRTATTIFEHPSTETWKSTESPCVWSGASLANSTGLRGAHIARFATIVSRWGSR